MRGKGGVPNWSGDATAVVVTLTVPSPARSGHVTAYPSGTDRPDTSNLNFAAHVTTAGTAVVPLGLDWMELYNGSAGPIDLIADVTGYYAQGTSTAPGTYVPVVPARLLDTRSGLGAPKAAVPAHATRVLQVAGRGGVPPSGAGAAVITLTVTEPAASGHVTVFADRTPRPGTSTLNFPRQSTIANLAVVTLGGDGKIALYNDSSGTVQLIVDVAGFYRSGTARTAGAFAATAPQRVLDTRSGVGAPTGPLAPQATLKLQIAGRSGVPAFAVGAVALNVTITNPSASGHLALGPSTSFLNYGPGDTRAELMVARVDSDGFVYLTNGSAGTVDVLADVAGYYLAAPAVSGLSTPNGSMAGGESITVTGLGFTPASSVLFGDVSAAAVTFIGPGSLTVTAPAHTAGLVDVTVTTAYGTSAVAAADRYYFLESPHPLTWSAETPVDPPGGHLGSVSCPSADFCAAIDGYGYVTSFDGFTWGTPLHVDVLGSKGATISCPAAGDCLAVTGDGEFAILRDGVWSAGPSVPEVRTDLMSCPAMNFCVAGSRGGEDLYTFDGSEWSTAAVDHPLLALSCSSASFCAATDELGGAITFDGDRWRERVLIDPGFEPALLSCPSSSFCLAADPYSSVQNVFRYDGTSWTQLALPGGSGPQALALTCSSATFCMVIDSSGRSLMYDGASWSSPASIPSGWEYAERPSLSCAGSAVCVLDDYGWRTAMFNGSAWTLVALDKPRGALSAISCDRSHSCAAADHWGNLMTTNGTGWGAPVDSGVEQFSYLSLSCPSHGFCMSVLGSHYVRYDGTGWNLQPMIFSAPGDVSCVSATWCLAVDALERWSIFNGSVWTMPRTISSGFLDEPDPSVSCPTTVFCAVALHAGQLYTWIDGSWKASPVPLPLATKVSCTSASFCMAVADDGSVSRYDGTAWSTPAPVAPGSTNLSCTSATHCVLAGANTQVWDGTAWSAPVPVPDTPSGPISCVSDSWCMALTTSGARTVTDP